MFHILSIPYNIKILIKQENFFSNVVFLISSEGNSLFLIKIIYLHLFYFIGANVCKPETIDCSVHLTKRPTCLKNSLFFINN